MQPIPNEHIARSLARSLLNIVGSDPDERYKHKIVTTVCPVRLLSRLLVGGDAGESEAEPLEPFSHPGQRKT